MSPVRSVRRNVASPFDESADLAELVGDGATTSVGVDVSGNFLSAPPPGLEFIRGDLSRAGFGARVAGRTSDRILFLQSFGYAKDPARTLQAARASWLTTDSSC